MTAAMNLLLLTFVAIDPQPRYNDERGAHLGFNPPISNFTYQYYEAEHVADEITICQSSSVSVTGEFLLVIELIGLS